MRKKRIFKWVIIAVPLFVVLYAVFVVGGSYRRHRQLVEDEMQAFPAPGVLVEVNDDGDTLHVYAEGEGDATLVFMSGLGTSSPVYDFQVLYRTLSEDYRVAVVERAGYGWSDITDSPRDLDTVLDETRTALHLAGESPPFVLFPHSLAGMEALYWTRKFPEEVAAIVGLDPLVPEYHQHTDDPPSFSRVVSFLARTGLMRHNEGVFRANFPAMREGLLSDSDAEVARTLFFRRVQTEPMWAEIEMLSENTETLLASGRSAVPFHVFISSENENDEWESMLTAYAEATGGEALLLEAGHYIHLHEPERIAEISRALIDQVLRGDSGG
jgi:pimeloyl-ACP methyl ester carboxylesterase